jgi:hypothetical protein
MLGPKGVGGYLGHAMKLIYSNSVLVTNWMECGAGKITLHWRVQDTTNGECAVTPKTFTPGRSAFVTVRREPII